MKHRHDFVFLFDCKDGNPNGDPDAANAPRIDPQDMHGLVSDVCLKRKIRNYVQIAKKNAPGFDIFIQDGGVLNESIRKAHTSLGHNLTLDKRASREQVQNARAEMCRRYYDVRTFGAVMSTGADAGKVRGPVQISFSRSIDPVLPLDLSITRMAVAEAKNDTSPHKTMGRKGLIPYGLFRCYGFVSAHLAEQSGFNEEDLNIFWEALSGMFDHDRSANRGFLSAQKLLVFKHDSALGNSPAHKLFDLLSIAQISEQRSLGRPPRSINDYSISVDRTRLPQGVEMIELI